MFLKPTIFCLLFASFASQGLEVVTTTTSLADVASAIGGSRVRVESITKGPQDPHFVEAKPSYVIKLRSADLIVAVGLELEIGWLPNIIRGARNPRIQPGQGGYFDAGSFITPINVPSGKLDRAKGDVHALGNPHFHLDPRRTLKVARALADRMAELDPGGAQDYHKNFKSFEKKLNSKYSNWQSRLARFKGKKVVTYHKTLNYFLQRFDLEFFEAIEPKAGIPPAARHILTLIQNMKVQKVNCLLVESFFEANAAKKVAKETGADLQRVPTEVRATDGAKSYFDLIESLVRAIENCGRSKGEKTSV